MSGQAPPATRYPLYAEQAPTVLPPQTPAAAQSVRPPAPPVGSPGYAPPGAYPPRPAGEEPREEHRRSWIVPVIAVASVVLLFGIGVAIVLNGGDDQPRESQPAASAEMPDSTAASDDVAPTTTDPTQSDPTATAPSTTGVTENLLPLITAIDVPGVAPPSTDARTGERVTFGAGNLTDEDPTTAWRTVGDATGKTLTIDFGSEIEIREVGMLNGYAKSYPGYDGYRLNRRVLAVNWVFDDGTELPLQLDNDRTPQAIRIDAVRTRTVRIEILQVSAPGRGPNGKDFTAISELVLGGVPA